MPKLVKKGYELNQERKVTVHKEYPEFLVKNFKTKEELFDFLDEDEPMILRELNICFENVPEYLSGIGVTGSHEDCLDCKEFIEKKHGCWEG